MKAGYKALRDCVFHNPLALPPLLVSAPKLTGVVDSYLPYSIGIEVECMFKAECEGIKRRVKYNDYLSYISGLVDFDIDDPQEKRFRIASGTRGLIALYHVCEFLKEACALNIKSGIHYHVDFREYFHKLELHSNQLPRTWILDQLSSWGYTGKFNKREVGYTKECWVRVHQVYKTMEIRIGEMSFEYDLLVKRILHCSYIAKRLKEG